MADIGKLQQTSITTEMKKAYLNYAMSVIVSRALPDVRDGLKPVHRRILYAMHEIGLTHSAKYKKSATVVGEVLGKYHPHGDVPVYDAMVRLAQDFAMRYPMIDGQGNFGSVDGDPPAAMRYCLIGNTLVPTNSGIKRLDQISKKRKETISIKILSQSQRINSASKWFDSGIHPTRKITTRQGFSVTGTYNHPVLTWTKNPITGELAYTWKLLEEIKKGDITVIDRSEDILWPTKELSIKKYAPKNVHVRWEIKQLPQTVTSDFAFILGSILAEGTIGKDKIEFCNSDFEWIETFKTAWKKTFPDTRLHEFQRKPSSFGKVAYKRLEIHSHYVISFLKVLGLAPVKSPERTIPWSILESPKHVVAAFLQAYFEGDGSISYAKKMNELSCCSKSELLLSQMQVLFLRFGITATKRFDTCRDIHKLYLRGRKNYLLFQKQIDFFSDRKKQKLQHVIDIIQKDNSLFDRVPFLRDYVYANMDKNLHYDNIRSFTYKHNFDLYSSMQANYQRVVPTVLSTLQPKLTTLFQKLLRTNYLYDEVVEIEDAGDQQVYSVRVDSTCHSFVANGFINHNTEARMAAISSEMLSDIEKETVNFTPNFDASLQEPEVLPARLPNLLLAGAEGIAVGMATKIPPHNLGEVIDAITYVIGKAKFSQPENTKATPMVNTGKSDAPLKTEKKITITTDVTVDELLEFVKGPDFPTAGSIYDVTEIRNAYVTGRGKVIIRGKAEIEEIGNGKSAIIITELPYQVNKALLVAKIADLAKEKKIDGISDLRDESDRRGLRIFVELKRDAIPKKVLNNLFKHTALQTSFPVNMVALVDGTPQTLNLKIILEEYLKHRYHVIRRRSEFELRQAKAREHILEGLKIAVDHIDAVIKTIRESATQDDAKKNLMTKFSLSEIQATAILDMQLRRLAALERQKIEDELELVRENIAYLEDLLSHPEKIMIVIKDELKNLKQKYADPRRTRVFKSKVGEFSEEDLIPNEPTVITLTDTGYIKRQSLNSFQTQNRGGKGIKGMTTKAEDTIAHIHFAQTHDNILFFTNKGKAYQLKAYEIAESSRISKGTAIVNLLNIETGEQVQSFVTYGKADRNTYVFLTTKNGTVKKSSISEFENIRKGGMIAIKLDAGDELVWSDLTDGKNDAMLVTREGKAIRFAENSVRPMGRATMGVRGIKIGANDEVIGMDIIAVGEKKELLTIMENGLGKRTDTALFRGQSRGGQGVKVANVNDKTGKVVVAQIIPPNTEEIIITSKKGQVVKLALNSIPRLGRDTQGVILMRFSDKTEKVASATCIEKSE